MNEDRFAELSAVLATKIHQIQRAVEVLQRAQRYDYGSGSYMEPVLKLSPSGDWIEFDDVAKAIQILQEGQQ